MKIKDIIKSIREEIKSIGELKHVYFVACGGSQAAIYAGYYLLQSESKTIGTSIYNSSEFVHSTPAMLGNETICVICSLKDTPESVEAVKVANSYGAHTIAMTGFDNTVMAETGKHFLVYSSGDNQIYSESNQSCSLRISFEILHQFEEYKNYKDGIKGFTLVNQVVDKGKIYIETIAKRFATEYSEDDIFYVLASGSMYSTAYTMSYCHLMEMQWKHAIPMHSGEYFHGPFETTDKSLPIILLVGEGRNRALDERAARFLKRYGERVTIIDSKEVGINLIPDSVVEFFNSVVMIPIERRLVEIMSEHRNHSMDQRRYMWKLEY